MSKIKTERKAGIDEDLLAGREGELLWEFNEEEILEEDDLKKIKNLKERLRHSEDENNEKTRIISNLRRQLEEAQQELAEREKYHHESQILIKTMEANLHQYENERKQFLARIEEQSKEIAALKDKCTLYEEDIKNLTNQLKSRTQENLILNKENKDLQRINSQLRDTITLTDDKLRGVERELARLEPERAEMERKYNRALESLRSEVKAKHQEILNLNREVSELKKNNQELKHANENLELELDMLNTTNVSLQKKIEKLNLQNSILERKLNNRAVRLVLGICSFFGWSAERKEKSFGA